MKTEIIDPKAVGQREEEHREGPVHRAESEAGEQAEQSERFDDGCEQLDEQKVWERDEAEGAVPTVSCS